MKISPISHPAISAPNLLRQALDRISHLEDEVQKMQSSRDELRKYIRICQSNRIIMVPVDDVLHIRAESNYSRVFLNNGNEYFTSRTLKAWIKEISSEEFIRCHRSYFVRKNKITEFNRRTNNIVMSDGECFPVSRRFESSVLSLFSGRGAGESKVLCNIKLLHPQT